MWEAKAAPGADRCALLAWLLGQAPGAAQVYRSSDRVVLIAELPVSPSLTPRGAGRPPPHAWEFDRSADLASDLSS